MHRHPKSSPSQGAKETQAQPPVNRTFPRKTAITIALFAALLSGLPAVPGLDWVRPPSQETFLSIFRNTPPPVKEKVIVVKAPEPKEPPQTPKPVEGPKPKPVVTRPDVVSTPGLPRITDPNGAMRHFYAALGRAEAREPGTVLHILHYGDSPTTADLITSDVRSLLQKRFGDGGHGFVLLSKPWAWYGHRGITLSSSGWTNDPASFRGGVKDRIHGLGGVSSSAWAGATSTVKLPDAHHTRVEVHFLKQPGGGEFKVEAGTQTVLTVSTAAETKGPGFESAALPPGTETVKLSVTRGAVRMFGWSFEKAGPGVVYSSIGLNGASVQTLVHHFEPNQWSEWLKHEKPDLVVLNYGSNEAENESYVDKYYSGEFRRLVERVHSFLPEASILVMSPMDRGRRTADGIVTVPALPRIVEIQEQIALETGVAFFNTYAAMGGNGTMAEWYAAKPRLVEGDYLHPTPGGAAKVGSLLEAAILEGFGRWKEGK